VIERVMLGGQDLEEIVERAAEELRGAHHPVADL